MSPVILNRMIKRGDPAALAGTMFHYMYNREHRIKVLLHVTHVVALFGAIAGLMFGVFFVDASSDSMSQIVDCAINGALIGAGGMLITIYLGWLYIAEPSALQDGVNSPIKLSDMID